MNIIKFNNFTFTDAGIKKSSGKLYQSKSILCDELPSDEFVFRAYADKASQGLLVTEGQLRVTDGDLYVLDGVTVDPDLPYGQPCYFYEDDTLVGKFYVKSVEYIQGNEYEFDAVSLPYLLMNIDHKGGIYSGVTAGTILASIMSGFTYTADADLTAVQINGWLPYGNCRDNLQQLLFAIGGNIFYDASTGNPHFKFNSDRTPTTIASSRIYLKGRSFNYKTFATKVNVSEYAYYALSTDTEATLYDNSGGTSVSDLLVKFDSPCHDLVATGLTISESGANYAIVSGAGTLTGKEYTVTEHVVTRSTGISGQTNEITESSCTLVSALNSANVAARLAAYYSQEREANMSIEVSGEQCGKLYRFVDPQGNTKDGYIVELNSTLSRIRKGEGRFAVNWQPGNFGNNFDHSVVLSDSGSWTVPSGVSSIRVVIAQGGQGGTAGGDGETSGRKHYTISGGYEWTKTAASKGGSKGAGGYPGKVLTVDISNLAASYAYSVGAGGAGGTAPAGAGTEGGHSTFGSYSSESGLIPENAIIDVVTGLVYSKNAYGVRDGIDGGDSAECITASLAQGAGESVTYEGTTWEGGAAGTYQWSKNRAYYGGGGGGGGAAYGSAGGAGGNGTATGPNNHTAGDGGTGADASQIPFTVGLGGGGQGGCGGGGGGYPGITGASGVDGPSGAAGVGGSGSDGGDGGAGYIIVYY